MPLEEKSKNVFQRLKPYYKHLVPVKWHFVGGILASLMYSVASGFGLPMMSKTAFPIIFQDKKEMESVPEWFSSFVEACFGQDPQQGLLIASVIALPAMMLLRSVGHFVSGYLMGYTGIRVSESIRCSIFRHMQTMPLAFFQKYKSGDLLARTTGDAEAIKGAVVNLSTDLFKQPMTLVSALGTLTYLAIKEDSFMFAVIAVCSAPLVILPIKAIGSKLARRSKQLADAGAELTSFTTESLQSPLEIRAYNLQDATVSKFEAQIRHMLNLSLKQVKYNLFSTPLIEVLAAMSLSFALYVGVSNGMDLGGFMALGIALYMAYEPVKKLGRIHGELKTLEAPLNRIEQIIDEPNTVPEPENPVVLPVDVKGSIRFEGVSFSYHEKSAAINAITCEIKQGEIVALVGSSGAGKTSFINLIPRFYDVDQGRISISGIAVQDLLKKDLRSIISYVPQMPILFNASIVENIRMGDLSASHEEVVQAAQLAFAHEFIMSTPDGYDTILSERGESLSGGQRQRIAIARAFLKNAPILILDEATSALDNESEDQITMALDKLMLGKTTLMIAHRESSLRAATRRIRFEDGSIVEDNVVKDI